jgi:hypothetical protein
MILFIDTEFADEGASDLVSIALVSDCGRFEFYAERNPLPARATHFVRSVVYPLLDRGDRALTDDLLTKELHSFFARVGALDRVLVAYDNQVDLKLLSHALEGFRTRPALKRPEFGVFDLGLLGIPFVDAVESRFETDPALRARRHNAFVDAWVNRDACVALRDRAIHEMAELQRLRTVDAELDQALEETFDMASKAASWWSSPSRMFAGRHPSQEYAEGRRSKVLEELGAIRHGFPA